MPIVSASTRRRLTRSACARATRSAAWPGTRTVRVSKKLSLARSYAGGAQAGGELRRPLVHVRAIERRPSGPWYTAYIEAITASSTWAVQMLDVAFSRRMCCSRVCRASRCAGRPAASTDTPTSRPGRDRRNSSRVARKPACGPPKPRGTPKRCDDPTRRRRPARPAGRAGCRPAGRWRRRPGRRRRAPPAMIGRRSRTTPDVPGCCSSDAEGVGGVEVGGRIADHDLDAERLGAGGHHGDGLRMALGVDEEHAARVACRAAQQGHRLGGRGGLVEHGGVGDLHAGEVAHHRLEVEERLEPALADLGLVGRVGRVPGRGSRGRCAGSRPACGCRGSPGRSAT